MPSFSLLLRVLRIVVPIETPSLPEKLETDMGDVPEVPTTTVKDSGPLVMDKKLSYLDVRTPEEYANEHVLGSVNIPWFLDLKTRQVRSKLRQHAPEP